MATSEWSAQSPRDNINPAKTKSYISSPPSATALPEAADAVAVAYESYLRLPELSKLWTSKDFPQWRHESILKPSLQALEITFRFVSVALSDPRPYANHREWKRRLESLAARQIELIATFCEDDDDGEPPIAELSSSVGVLTRERSSQEVWKVPGSETSVVSRTSEASLLPRLAAWDTSEDVAGRILFQIESQMQRCRFTLGLGEPNLAGKPTLEYDLVVRPSELHSLKKSPYESKKLKNQEEQILFTIHQILESWLFVARELLCRINWRIDDKEWGKAASDCWMLERIWKLLAEVEDLHLLMDPDDLLRLKDQLAIKGSSETFCFRSAALREVTGGSKELKRMVPWILEVEADPMGGPRVQEAAIGLFHSRRRGEGGRVELLQGMQAIEAAVRRFYFGYRQVVTAAMGSAVACGNRPMVVPWESLDSLAQKFLEAPYFPSLDAAKTFLADYWQQQQQQQEEGRLNSSNINA